MIRSVLKYYKLIIACSIFTGVLVYLFTMTISRKYESTAIVYTGIATGVTPVSMQSRSDMMSAYPAFDNLTSIIKSRATLKEVGLKLFAYHLHAAPGAISEKHFNLLQGLVPPDIRILVGETDSITYRNLLLIAETNPFLINLINYPQTPYYNTFALSGIIISRQRSSDMISLSYVCDDPGVSKKTLEILIDVCIRNYRKIKEGQTDKVVAYYEEELRHAQERLKRSEAKEQRFKETNNLVDYTTQTGIVIEERQGIINQINQANEAIYATEAGIKNIESQLGTQSQSLKNVNITEKRERLRRLNTQLSTAEFNNASAETIFNIQSQIDQVKGELINDISASSASTSGGKISETAAGEYFSRVVSYEESKARLRALESRRDITMGQYNRFLPLGDTLKRIQRDIEIDLKAYFTALESLNQSKKQQQDQRSFSTIDVIDAPNYPLTAKSKRKTLILLGLLVGGIIPTAIIVAMAYFDKNLLTPLRAEQATGLKIGGIIPNAKILGEYKNPEQVSDGLNDTILKNLYLSDYKGNQQRILVVSTRPSEGKTTICNMLCERLIRKGKKCLVVVPYLDSGSWSVVSYKVDNAFYQARAEDLVPVEKLNETDILILELPSLIMSDYPVALIKEFDMAFLVCDAKREWTKADQTALDSFVKISGLTPQIILNEVDSDVVEEVLGKISRKNIL